LWGISFTICNNVTEFGVGQNSEFRRPADSKSSLEFCITTQSCLGFSTKFQLALSSTRPKLCTLSQSSPNCASAIRTTLAWSMNKAHLPFCSILRTYTLNAITLRWTISNRYTCNCSTPNLKIEWVKSRKRHHTLYLSQPKWLLG
jgi:hypothetical protein